MDGKAHRADAGQRGGKAIGGDCFVRVDPEFVLFFAGRDLGVGLRVDVGIDPERNSGGAPRSVATAARRRSSGSDSTFNWWMPWESATAISRRSLADPRENDALGRNAGGESAPQLALRDDVRAGPETGKNPQHGEVRIGLDGITDERLFGGRRRRRRRRYWATKAAVE